MGQENGLLKWEGELKFRATGTTGKQITLDGAQGVGPNPMELVLLALGGCSGMDVISILEKKRQQVTGFELRLEGTRAEEHPKVYTELSIVYILRGRSLDPQAVARAVELSETRYCSVMAMLRKAASITTRYEIIEEE